MPMDKKRLAAEAALSFVRDRMIIGLGTGSTAAEFIILLAEKVKKERLHVNCVSTSHASEELARRHGLKLVPLYHVHRIDLAVDGADKVDKNLDMLKGRGGALLREKVIDYRAKKFICIADDSKLGPLAGMVPIEVVPFASATILKELRAKGKKVSLRLKDDKPLVTDNGNYILDLQTRVKNAKKEEAELNNIPGVLENGIFTKVSAVIIAYEDKVVVKKR